MVLRKIRGPLLLVTAAVACPCHVPLALGLLAGTSLGGFLLEHQGLLILGLSGYFVLALALGVRSMRAADLAGEGLPVSRGGALRCRSCANPSELSAPTAGERTKAGVEALP